MRRGPKPADRRGPRSESDRILARAMRLEGESRSAAAVGDLRGRRDRSWSARDVKELWGALALEAQIIGGLIGARYGKGFPIIPCDIE